MVDEPTNLRTKRIALIGIEGLLLCLFVAGLVHYRSGGGLATPKVESAASGPREIMPDSSIQPGTPPELIPCIKSGNPHCGASLKSASQPGMDAKEDSLQRPNSSNASFMSRASAEGLAKAQSNRPLESAARVDSTLLSRGELTARNSRMAGASTIDDLSRKVWVVTVHSAYVSPGPEGVVNVYSVVIDAESGLQTDMCTCDMLG